MLLTALVGFHVVVTTRVCRCQNCCWVEFTFRQHFGQSPKPASANVEITKTRTASTVDASRLASLQDALRFLWGGSPTPGLACGLMSRTEKVEDATADLSRCHGCELKLCYLFSSCMMTGKTPCGVISHGLTCTCVQVVVFLPYCLHASRMALCTCVYVHVYVHVHVCNVCMYV